MGEIPEGTVYPLQPALATVGLSDADEQSVPPGGRTPSLARTSSKFVEPREFPLGTEVAVALFGEAGWSQNDAAWLAPLALGAAQAEPAEPPSELAQETLRFLAKRHSDDASNNTAALLILFAKLCGFGEPHQNGLMSLPTSKEKRVIDGRPWPEHVARTFAAHGSAVQQLLQLDAWPSWFNCSPVDWRSPRREPLATIAAFMRLAFSHASLDLGSLWSTDAIKSRGETLVTPRPETTSNPSVSENGVWWLAFEGRPRELGDWLLAVGAPALPHIGRLFASAAASSDAPTLFGLCDTIERWLAQPQDNSNEQSIAAAPALVKLLRDLMNVIVPAVESQVVTLRRSILWVAHILSTRAPRSFEELPEVCTSRLLLAAGQELASMRKLFASAKPGTNDSAPSIDPALLFTQWEERHMRHAVGLLYCHGGVWKGLKPMLLAWRALSVQGVSRDLRYWNEHTASENPSRWQSVFSAPIFLFHNLARTEESRDPGLVKLRGELAAFCLDRLVDRWSAKEREEAARAGRTRTAADMKEPSPEWRYCYIRAVMTLGINPEGKGHRALHFAAQHDPDPDVREVAKDAYERLRRGVSLPEDSSPRRAVMSSLWWLRQAHLLGLGIQPDPDGAQRTRSKELSRTKEAERASDHP